MNKNYFSTVTLALCCCAISPAGGQANKPMMKAIVVHEFGGPEVLKYEDAPRPEPKENEVLIRVIAAGVNPVETDKEVSPKPKSLTFEEAAAVPLAAETAWQALFDTAKLSAGQTVLIHGGSGGVGSFAIQFAKARGAKVFATASTLNQDLLKQLGADVAIDYTKQKFEDIAKDVDVVMDSIGKDTLARSYGVVKKGGFIVSLVARPNPAELEKHGIRGAPMSVDPNSA